MADKSVLFHPAFFVVPDSIFKLGGLDFGFLLLSLCLRADSRNLRDREMRLMAPSKLVVG